MRLDFPIEILDKSVDISVQRAASGTGNQLDEEVAHHMRSQNNLDLTNVPFFRFVYSMILQVH